MFLYGEMWALSIKFNTVSVVNLIMATGLAVDYAIYFVVKFMATGGDTRNQRVITCEPPFSSNPFKAIKFAAPPHEREGLQRSSGCVVSWSSF